MRIKSWSQNFQVKTMASTVGQMGSCSIATYVDFNRRRGGNGTGDEAPSTGIVLVSSFKVLFKLEDPKDRSVALRAQG